MKIAVAANINSMDGQLDKQFGRAPGFIIFDDISNTHKYIDNQGNKSSAQGAGIQAAQNIINSGATLLICNQCGPKALKVLNSANVTVYISPIQSILNCIEQSKSNNLNAMKVAQ
ncbi:NifB/NifX family molybdenum-iron cluster-binding protein [Psychromonas sp. PT13]|uniref:NifB/NifX family molybdenum-iron cluster-binding protein n=1 Tax=Psychromonas sp. PT13 TaxID=3439547 RepID=UPI003EC029A5